MITGGFRDLGSSGTTNNIKIKQNLKNKPRNKKIQNNKIRKK